jgi:ferredoxin
MPEAAKKKKCPDCDYCQMCSESRCRLCRNDKTCCMKSQLGSAFTYGEYREWQKKRAMKKIPVIDVGRCTDCESCLEMCPEVFKRNSETGLIEVADQPDYPEELVDQVISICPADCISWEEI